MQLTSISSVLNIILIWIIIILIYSLEMIKLIKKFEIENKIKYKWICVVKLRYKIS